MFAEVGEGHEEVALGGLMQAEILDVEIIKPLAELHFPEGWQVGGFFLALGLDVLASLVNDVTQSVIAGDLGKLLDPAPNLALEYSM